jgi:two-component system, cell cycle response regulator DivK
MDLGMPVMDGCEATRRLKSNDDLRHIPVIAITSHAMVGDEIEARKAGCDDYLPKPIDEDLLIKKLRSTSGDFGWFDMLTAGLRFAILRRSLP